MDAVFEGMTVLLLASRWLHVGAAAADIFEPQNREELQSALFECVGNCTGEESEFGRFGGGCPINCCHAATTYPVAGPWETGTGANCSGINTWIVSSVYDMSSLFLRAYAFNQSISLWDVSNVRSMQGMFSAEDRVDRWNTQFPTNFNGDLSQWDVSRVQNLEAMFFDQSSFNSNISSWDVSSAVSLHMTFWHTSLNQDLSGWDVGRAMDMREMFYSAWLFNGDVSTWNVRRVTSMRRSEYTVHVDVIISSCSIASLYLHDFYKSSHLHDFYTPSPRATVYLFPHVV